MNQNVIVIASIVGFIVIVSLSVFIYFQEPQISLSYEGVHCSFTNSSLLNYLHNPQCSRPLGIELHENYGCVTYFDRSGYGKVECEDPNKAWVSNGCLHVDLEDNTIAKCP